MVHGQQNIKPLPMSVFIASANKTFIILYIRHIPHVSAASSRHVQKSYIHGGMYAVKSTLR
jgi:hypothetical protein